MQIFDRGNDYNQVLLSQPLAAATSIYGPRKDSPQTMEMVTSVDVGRKLLMIKARVATLDRNVVKGTLSAKFCLYEAMDLVLLTDEEAGIFEMPARITSWEEDKNYNIAFEASPFIRGEHAPDSNLNASSPIQTPPPLNELPGDANAPIIFQPVPRLLQNQNQPELWIVTSGGGRYYGGCMLFISTDGGASYNPLINGYLPGSAVTGYTVNDWSAASDPDATNALLVDLTESNGALASYSLSDENNFVYPFYVSGGGDSIAIVDGGYPIILLNGSMPIASMGGIADGATDIASGVISLWDGSTEIARDSDGIIIAELGAVYDVSTDICDPTIEILDETTPIAGSGYNPFIPYELGSYSTATLMAAYQYILPVGSGTYIRRAVFGAPFLGQGTDHPVNSRFCVLNPSGIGIAKIPLDSRWIGQPLYFKLCAFNEFGGELQSLGDVTAYLYIPIVGGISPTYTQSPATALAQALGTFNIYMQTVVETFATNPAQYNARVFPVPDPGGTPTWYYITIADPAYLGDTGSGTNLTAYCDTDNSKVGVAGFINIGAILVTHAGGPTTTQPGGWPVP
jgi:hypothetical protein